MHQTAGDDYFLVAMPTSASVDASEGPLAPPISDSQEFPSISDNGAYRNLLLL